MYCRYCGKELLNRAKFCQSCGAKVLDDEIPEPVEAEIVEEPKVEDKVFEEPVTDKPKISRKDLIFGRIFTYVGLGLGALSLITSITMIFNIILFAVPGLIFSIIGLKKTNMKTAIVGIILSSIGIFISLAIFIAVICIPFYVY